MLEYRSPRRCLSDDEMYGFGGRDPAARPGRAKAGVSTIGRMRTMVTVSVVAVFSVGCAGGSIDGGDGASPATASPTARALQGSPSDGTMWGPGRHPCPQASQLSLRAQLAQTLFVGVDGSAASVIRRLVDRPEPVGGIFVGGTTTDVFLSGTLRDLSQRPVPPLVGVDDEGGRVQRIEALAGDLPSARLLGQESPERIRAIARERGRWLAGFGVTINFAPVVDLGGQADSAVIGDRAFGKSPSAVSRAAGAFAAGLRDAGVLPTLKHFPGHGRGRGDSHTASVTTPSWSVVKQSDLEPYRALLDDGPVAVMAGHLIVPGLTKGGVPTSLDPATYRVLREDLHADGLVLTDELSQMRAVSARFGVTESVRRAIAAGADMALVAAPGPLDGLLDRLQAQVKAGRLPRERVVSAAGRVLQAKHCT
jgi:beta-N-acetylhexosaminidase